MALTSNTNYSGIPLYMQGSVYNYIEHGQPIGNFLTAVFSNDLMKAFACADKTNIESMREYATMLYSAPIACYGSEEKIAIWQEHKGISGLYTKNNTDITKSSLDPLI